MIIESDAPQEKTEHKKKGMVGWLVGWLVLKVVWGGGREGEGSMVDVCCCRFNIS